MGETVPVKIKRKIEITASKPRTIERAMGETVPVKIKRKIESTIIPIEGKEEDDIRHD